MPTSDDIDETPWKPLSIRERVYFAIIRILTWVFRVDFFDVYRRQDVKYDGLDGYYRIGMEPISNLKDEWLHTYQKQAEYYEDNDDKEWVPYTMWLVMRSDETINPPVSISGERQPDGSWDTTVHDGPDEPVKAQRKKEILLEIDETGFIDPVLDENKQKNNQP